MKQTFEDSANNGLFVLNDLSCQENHATISTGGMYRIAWLLDGEIELNVDTIPTRLQKNQMIFFTPHNQVSFTSASCEQLISISFNREFYCINDHDHEVSCYGHLFYGSTEAPLLTLDEKEIKSISTWFEVLKEEFEFSDHIQGEMLRILLKRFLIKSSRLARDLLINPEIKDNQLDIIRQFNVLVEMHFRSKHQVQEYADMLFKSPKTLSNLFKQYNEKTPLKIINERIELEAKRLLSHSDKTIEEIAYELGYGDGAQLSRFFKKQTNQSPKSFRSDRILVQKE